MARHYALRGERHFQWRGRDVSRIENLSDIVFALVLALAATQSIPTTFDELAGLWRDALSLAACFALIIFLWRTHHVFFRRYDLQDSVVSTLNAVLLFLLLAYIYPLKFMTDFVINLYTGYYTAAHPPNAVLEYAQVKWLYLIYGGFFAAVFGLFALLYAHALRHADDIGLDPVERIYTRYEVEFALGVVVLSILIVVSAFMLPTTYSAFVGMAYALMGVVAWIAGGRATAKVKTVDSTASAQTKTASSDQ
ncbi:TMEM175 family protein [Oceanicaulis sp. MMSF_3324]|uniref:TMEM175 family protein n=1 Tax=Oceanicaulis sp. MMSF_3324 TaxID=3046702 RepID=UPI00273ED314|nr:TMEM175 family protein [Oceanicaulis sp. MMSF_3324]